MTMDFHIVIACLASYIAIVIPLMVTIIRFSSNDFIFIACPHLVQLLVPLGVTNLPT